MNLWFSWDSQNGWKRSRGGAPCSKTVISYGFIGSGGRPGPKVENPLKRVIPTHSHTFPWKWVGFTKFPPFTWNSTNFGVFLETWSCSYFSTTFSSTNSNAKSTFPHPPAAPNSGFALVCTFLRVTRFASKVCFLQKKNFAEKVISGSRNTNFA